MIFQGKSKKNIILSAVAMPLVLAAVPFGVHALENNSETQKNSDMEIAPYIKGGTIAWDQLEGKGGHKLLLAGGLDVKLNFDDFSTSLNLEAWFIAEGMDDDQEIIPADGYSLTVGGRYFFLHDDTLDWYVYGDLGYEEWNRSKTETSWSDVGFFNVEAGIGFEFERGMFQLGINSPFGTHTSEGFEANPRFGFSALGKYRVLDPLYVGLFYDYQALEFEYLGQPYPDAKMIQTGVLLQYVF